MTEEEILAANVGAVLEAPIALVEYVQNYAGAKTDVVREIMGRV